MKSINCPVRTNIDLDAFAYQKPSTRAALKKISRKQLRAREKHDLLAELLMWHESLHNVRDQRALERVECESVAYQLRSNSLHSRRSTKRRHGNRKLLRDDLATRQLIDRTVIVRYMGHNHSVREVEYQVHANCACA